MLERVAGAYFVGVHQHGRRDVTWKPPIGRSHEATEPNTDNIFFSNAVNIKCSIAVSKLQLVLYHYSTVFRA